jgi:hypothetical protein
MAASLRLTVLSIVVVKWSKDLFIIYIILMFMLMIINRLAEFSQKYSSVTSTAFLFYLHLWMMVCFNMQLNCSGSSD